MLLWLENKQGMRIGISTWGASWLACQVPMGNGELREVVLGSDDPQRMVQGGAYLGCSVGRYCGRIAEARFMLDGVAHEVEANEGANHLHGGKNGLSRREWTVVSHSAQTLVLSVNSADGEGGFPANVTVQATFHLDNDNTVMITYRGESDAPTVLNLCNHVYFNMNGIGQPALTQKLAVEAERYVPVDAAGIPTADGAEMAGSAFDCRALRTIEQGIYDHSFWLTDGRNLAATLESASGDLRLYVMTTQPVIHVYTGQGLAGEPDSQGQPYLACAGVALETQAPADSANRHPALVRVTPDAAYEHRTQYYFEVG